MLHSIAMASTWPESAESAEPETPIALIVKPEPRRIFPPLDHPGLQSGTQSAIKDGREDDAHTPGASAIATDVAVASVVGLLALPFPPASRTRTLSFIYRT